MGTNTELPVGFWQPTRKMLQEVLTNSYCEVLTMDNLFLIDAWNFLQFTEYNFVMFSFVKQNDHKISIINLPKKVVLKKTEPEK